MEHYIYILCSQETGKLYIGSTSDPDQRLKEHNAGKSAWTRKYRPWERIWLEKLDSKEKALSREKYLKSGWGRKWIEKNVLCK
jgi:putative endonuclease